MSISAAEYAAGLTILLGSLPQGQLDRVAHALGAGVVTCTFEPLAPVKLGGLLELPRARVTLSFAGASEAERQAFLRRFDVTFQRGGG